MASELADVLRLSRPQEYVMDLKGETVFRRRPFYYTIEAVTKAHSAVPRPEGIGRKIAMPSK